MAVETVRAAMKLKRKKRKVRNSNKLPGQRLLIELGVPKELSVGRLASDFDRIERVHSIAPSDMRQPEWAAEVLDQNKDNPGCNIIASLPFGNWFPQTWHTLLKGTDRATADAIKECRTQDVVILKLEMLGLKLQR